MFIRAGRAAPWVAACVFFSTIASAQDVVITEACQRRFQLASELLRNPDGPLFEQAYREYELLYEECPTPKVLGNWGYVAMNLERYGEAIRFFERYLAMGKNNISAQEWDDSNRDLLKLKSEVAWVTLDLNEAGASVLNVRTKAQGEERPDEPVSNQYKLSEEKIRLGLRYGQHRFTISLAGHEDIVWEANLKPGANVSKSFEFVPLSTSPKEPDEAKLNPPEPEGSKDLGVEKTERPVPASVYLAGGVALAGFIGFGVLGGMASAKNSDYQSANNGQDPGKAQDLKDSGEQLNLFADIGLGVGILSGVLTAVLYLNRPEVPVMMDRSVQISPNIGPNTASISLSKRF